MKSPFVADKEVEVLGRWKITFVVPLTQVSLVWNGSLVALLRTLTMLGLPSDAPVLHSIQNEVLWRIRRLTYRQLAYLVDWIAFQRKRG